MTERITPEQFVQADGVEDWRVPHRTAYASFETGSFAVGVALVNAIGVLADAADHHPDVDLRYSRVGVRLTTHDVDGLSPRDVDLARQISAAARDLGASPILEVPFWPALLGDRVPLDVPVPPEEAADRVAAALAAGARLVDDSQAPAWWLLSTPDGTNVRVTTRPRSVGPDPRVLR